MPIYEFKCQKCGDTFEFLRFHSDDDDNTTCPSCGSKQTERLLSSFSSVSSSPELSSCAPSGGFS